MAAYDAYLRDSSPTSAPAESLPILASLPKVDG